jgi:hypothetical protein
VIAQNPKRKFEPKMPVAKGSYFAKRGPSRTVGGRITYAGIDAGENVRQRRDWYGAGK